MRSIGPPSMVRTCATDALPIEPVPMSELAGEVPHIDPPISTRQAQHGPFLTGTTLDLANCLWYEHLTAVNPLTLPDRVMGARIKKKCSRKNSLVVGNV